MVGAMVERTECHTSPASPELAIGWRCEVFWAGKHHIPDEWYSGTVGSYSATRGYRIEYDDGDQAWESVDRIRWLSASVTQQDAVPGTPCATTDCRRMPHSTIIPEMPVAEALVLGSRAATKAAERARICPICLDALFQPLVTTCGHSFCAPCIKRALHLCKPECPTCRQPLSSHRVLRRADSPSLCRLDDSGNAVSAVQEPITTHDREAWKCSACKLGNPESASRCTACSARRPASSFIARRFHGHEANAESRRAASSPPPPSSPTAPEGTSPPVRRVECCNEARRRPVQPPTPHATKEAPNASPPWPKRRANEGGVRRGAHSCGETPRAKQARRNPPTPMLTQPPMLAGPPAHDAESLHEDETPVAVPIVELKAVMVADRPSATGYKGVHLCSNTRLPYRADVCDNGRKVTLGRFKTTEEAAACYTEHQSRKLAARAAAEPRPLSLQDVEEMAAAEGLQLVTSVKSNAGYK